MESKEVGDNVIAILAGLRDHRRAVRKIVQRIAGLRGSGGGGAGDRTGAVGDPGGIATLGENGRAGGAKNADYD